MKKIIVLAVALCLTGCAATHTMIHKRHLDVQTKMSETIFLDPVPEAKKTVFVQIKNTSDKQSLAITSAVVAAIEAKGFRVVPDLEWAHYMVQANVLQVGKTDIKRASTALSEGFGGAVTGLAIAGTVGRPNDHTAVGAGLIGAVFGTIADALVEDVAYSIVTDIQISERAANDVTIEKHTEKHIQSKFKQGISDTVNIDVKTSTDWIRYQTRILNTANKVNLKFEEALPSLITGLSTSIAGIVG